MSKKDKDSNIFEKIFKDKKKLALLLLLLVGTVVVTTSVFALGQPNDNSLSSSGPTGSSSQPSTSSSASTSYALFSGSEIPEWDLTSPEISADSSAFNVELDATWYARFQEDYYYAIGGTMIDELPEAKKNNSSYMMQSGRILNLKTNELLFSYNFNPGQDYINFLETTDQFPNFQNNRSIAYDGGDNVYMMLTIQLQTIQNNPDSRIGGDYQPIIDLITTTYQAEYDEGEELYSKFFYTLLRFSLSSPETFTILAVTHSLISDILIENDTFYLAISVVISGFNSQTKPLPFLDIIPVPAEFENIQLAFLYELVIETNGLLTFSSGRFIGNVGQGSVVAFVGYRDGFYTRYVNDLGFLNLLIQTPRYLTSNFSAFNTLFSTFDANYLSPESVADFKPMMTQYAEERYDMLESMIGQSTFNTSLFNTFIGFFDPVSGTLIHPTLSVTAIAFFNNSFYNAYYSTSRLSFPGDYNFILVSKGSSIQSSTPAYPIEYSYRIYREDKLTGVMESEPVLEFDQDGYIHAGFYKKEGGYFLSGTLYDYEDFNPTVQKSAAVLRELDEDFNVVNELILDGSEDDTGGAIALNNVGQPVWFVTSNSIDGPFAAFAASNPSQARRTYTVSFN